VYDRIEVAGLQPDAELFGAADITWEAMEGYPVGRQLGLEDSP